MKTLRGEVSWTLVATKANVLQRYFASRIRGHVLVDEAPEVQSVPEILLISLKRFRFVKHLGVQKRLEPILPEPLIDLADWSGEEGILNSSPQEGTRYRLQAIISHVGESPDSGHYIASIKSANGLWYDISDKCIINDNKNLAVISRAGHKQKLLAANLNAPEATPYVLAYVRQAEPNTSLTPLSPSAFPASPDEALHTPSVGTGTKDSRSASSHTRSPVIGRPSLGAYETSPVVGAKRKLSSRASSPPISDVRRKESRTEGEVRAVPINKSAKSPDIKRSPRLRSDSRTHYSGTIKRSPSAEQSGYPHLHRRNSRALYEEPSWSFDKINKVVEDSEPQESPADHVSEENDKSIDISLSTTRRNGTHKSHKRLTRIDPERRRIAKISRQRRSDNRKRSRRTARSSPRLKHHYPALLNPNNLCYRNAVLNMLMNIPSFISYLEDSSHVDKCPLGIAECMLCEMHSIADAYRSSNVYHTRRSAYQNWVDHFWDTFASRSVFNGGLTLDPQHTISWEQVIGDFKVGSDWYYQQDAHEYLEHLVNYMTNNASSDSPILSDLNALFYITTRETFLCGNTSCRATSQAESTTLPYLWAYLPDHHTRPHLNNCLWHRFSVSTETKRCGKCHERTEGLKKENIECLPEVLFVSIPRLNIGHKIRTIVDIPEELDLDEFVDGSHPSVAESETRYKLQAMVLHHGSSRGGHYIASVQRDEDGTWFDIDDYGSGEDGHGVFELGSLYQASRAYDTPQHKAFTPYILAYVKVRENNWPETPFLDERELAKARSSGTPAIEYASDETEEASIYTLANSTISDFEPVSDDGQDRARSFYTRRYRNHLKQMGHQGQYVRKGAGAYTDPFSEPSPVARKPRTLKDIFKIQRKRKYQQPHFGWHADLTESRSR
ncbi:MAG: hypothetical protein Q9227_004668 [Pyrenula ochraceoflavens]